jgi:hypothetical protein
MAVNRVLYATQRCVINQNNGTSWILPTQTASADETIPQDDVLVLGKLGGVARLQKDVASCKASVKAYICHSITEGSSALDVDTVLASTFLNALIADASAGLPGKIYVDSTGHSATKDGFQFHGTLSSIGVDASKGAFPMLDLSFEGVGRLEELAMGTNTTLAGSNAGSVGYISKATPATSEHISCTGSSGDTVASVKFSHDMPTETLSALGSTIQGSSSNVAAGNKVFSKPPFKTSITADGQDLNALNAAWITASASGATLGGINMTINDPASTALVMRVSSAVNVSTRSFSQNVGDIGATFSVTAEGTNASFATV